MNSNQSALLLILLFLLASSPIYAVELVNKSGAFQSKTFQGRIYDARGKYTGMITPEGKMYDQDGNFTGQIKNQSILDKDGNNKGVIRDGKIYDKEGLYKGQLKQ